MVGFYLKNTVTENGYVSRGVCQVEKGMLQSITERTHIEKKGMALRSPKTAAKPGRPFLPIRWCP